MATINAQIKYRVSNDGEDIIVITEDGGIVTYAKKEEYFLMECYQLRIDSDMTSDNIWDKLGEGHIYNTEYSLDKPDVEILIAALNFLYPFVSENNFVHTQNLFTHIFPFKFNKQVIIRDIEDGLNHVLISLFKNYDVNTGDISPEDKEKWEKSTEQLADIFIRLINNNQ